MGRAVHVLTNTVQHYDWGSPVAVHELLGTTPDGRPAAELWLGAHPSAPSRTADGVRLDDLIHDDPVGTLGTRVSDGFGPRLPFLLKVLAAERALSLQVHPRPHAARAGFNRENRTGVPLGSPQRSFHDDQHKPEMVVALTRFEALAGFRSPRAALRLLQGLDGELVARAADALARDRSGQGLRAAFGTLVAARGDAACREHVDQAVASVRARLEAGSPSPVEDATVLLLAQQHPGDPGAVASLLLNRLTLEPGRAMFVPPGEVHAYLSGLAVEVMASSDNVLRAGLTTKHVDEPALVECASFEPSPPVTPRVAVAGRHSRVVTFRAPVEEFALTAAAVDPAEPAVLPPAGPRVLLALDGRLELRHAGGTTPLPRGRSVFVPDATGPLEAAGEGRLVCAWVP
ncbi:mannose-6-phosphate isomerase, class I [Puerhibacterium puerhi]|uniref:mannose-6-phosphate isomerase, class I n=1 Tax=Puerhibacterium puerhi TaxID=2692623 RepID=UPI001F27A9A2|nr:mannose-6-phosphate isomerase, class I [Puerhibacterium puerhi]